MIEKVASESRPTPFSAVTVWTPAATAPSDHEYVCVNGALVTFPESEPKIAGNETESMADWASEASTLTSNEPLEPARLGL